MEVTSYIIVAAAAALCGAFAAARYVLAEARKKSVGPHIPISIRPGAIAEGVWFTDDGGDSAFLVKDGKLYIRLDAPGVTEREWCRVVRACARPSRVRNTLPTIMALVPTEHWIAVSTLLGTFEQVSQRVTQSLLGEVEPEPAQSTPIPEPQSTPSVRLGKTIRRLDI